MGEPDASAAVERETADAVALLDRLPDLGERITRALGESIIGQSEAVQTLLIAVLAEGHALVEGVPGLAKTLLVRELTRLLGLESRRVQFTPDLMPSDVVGGEVLDVDPATGARSLRFVPGPVFTSVLLADELNRTPPKTQAALLEAMGERQVTAGGRTHRLPRPFVVIATRNPIEQEGTYPLPEAQLDRFLVGVRLGYPPREDELAIVGEGERLSARLSMSKEGDGGGGSGAGALLSAEELVRLRWAIGAIPLSGHVTEAIVDAVRCTRPEDPSAPAAVREGVAWGAGPRAGQAWALAARVLAALEGEPTPTVEHVARLAGGVLEHRLLMSWQAASTGLSPAEVVSEVLESSGLGRRRRR
ncbi:MAG: AAA family ATPase [Phycisphaerales bacterium]